MWPQIQNSRSIPDTKHLGTDLESGYRQGNEHEPQQRHVPAQIPHGNRNYHYVSSNQSNHHHLEQEIQHKKLQECSHPGVAYEHGNSVHSTIRNNCAIEPGFNPMYRHNQVTNRSNSLKNVYINGQGFTEQDKINHYSQKNKSSSCYPHAISCADTSDQGQQSCVIQTESSVSDVSLLEPSNNLIKNGGKKQHVNTSQTTYPIQESMYRKFARLDRVDTNVEKENEPMLVKSIERTSLPCSLHKFPKNNSYHDIKSSISKYHSPSSGIHVGSTNNIDTIGMTHTAEPVHPILSNKSMHGQCLKQLPQHPTNISNSSFIERPCDKKISNMQVSSSRCTCKKSKCLKLYCQCFASSSLCDPEKCKCVNCENSIGKNEEIENARHVTLERNPRAFEDKFKSEGIYNSNVGSRKHNNGPNPMKIESRVIMNTNQQPSIPPSHKGSSYHDSRAHMHTVLVPQQSYSNQVASLNQMNRELPSDSLPNDSNSQTMYRGQHLRIQHDHEQRNLPSGSFRDHTKQQYYNHQGNVNAYHRNTQQDNHCIEKNMSFEHAFTPSQVYNVGNEHHQSTNPSQMHIKTHSKRVSSGDSSNHSSFLYNSQPIPQSHIQFSASRSLDETLDGKQSSMSSSNKNPIVSHKHGCKCRKSFCLKKYCECYHHGAKCGNNCRCIDCKNKLEEGDDKKDSHKCAPGTESGLIQSSTISDQSVTKVNPTDSKFSSYPQNSAAYEHVMQLNNQYQSQPPGIVQRYTVQNFIADQSQFAPHGPFKNKAIDLHYEKGVQSQRELNGCNKIYDQRSISSHQDQTSCLEQCVKGDDKQGQCKEDNNIKNDNVECFDQNTNVDVSLQENSQQLYADDIKESKIQANLIIEKGDKEVPGISDESKKKAETTKTFQERVVGEEQMTILAALAMAELKQNYSTTFNIEKKRKAENILTSIDNEQSNSIRRISPFPITKVREQPIKFSEQNQRGDISIESQHCIDKKKQRCNTKNIVQTCITLLPEGRYHASSPSSSLSNNSTEKIRKDDRAYLDLPQNLPVVSSSPSNLSSSSNSSVNKKNLNTNPVNIVLTSSPRHNPCYTQPRCINSDEESIIQTHEHQAHQTALYTQEEHEFHRLRNGITHSNDMQQFRHAQLAHPIHHKSFFGSEERRKIGSVSPENDADHQTQYRMQQTQHFNPLMKTNNDVRSGARCSFVSSNTGPIRKGAIDVNGNISTGQQLSSSNHVVDKKRQMALPKSLSFRKICSKCGKTRGEHGELGFGNKCVYQECGRCGAGVQMHVKAKVPMGFFCSLSVDNGAQPTCIRNYDKRINDLAIIAELKKEVQSQQQLPIKKHLAVKVSL